MIAENRNIIFTVLKVEETILQKWKDCCELMIRNRPSFSFSNCLNVVASSHKENVAQYNSLSYREEIVQVYDESIKQSFLRDDGAFVVHNVVFSFGTTCVFLNRNYLYMKV